MSPQHENTFRSQAGKAVAKEIFSVSSWHSRPTKPTQLVLMLVILIFAVVEKQQGRLVQWLPAGSPATLA